MKQWCAGLEQERFAIVEPTNNNTKSEQKILDMYVCLSVHRLLKDKGLVLGGEQQPTISSSQRLLESTCGVGYGRIRLCVHQRLDYFCTALIRGYVQGSTPSLVTRSIAPSPITVSPPSGLKQLCQGFPRHPQPCR